MKKEIYYIGGLLIVIVLLSVFRKPVKEVVTKKLSRGYRNNNPGNIVKTKTKWKGEIASKDKRFKTFINMEYGYRAIFVTLNSYIRKGFNTISKIINRYAPPHENVTSAYVKHVSEETGIPKDEPIEFAETDKIKKIVASISRIENGIKPNLNQIEEGYKLYMTA